MAERANRPGTIPFDDVADHSMKQILFAAAVAEQASLQGVCCALCCVHSSQYVSLALQQVLVPI